MKKFIAVLIFSILGFNPSYASLIELENCFNTAFFWDYTKQGSDLEFPSHEQVKWTKENHFRGTTLIKISKKFGKKIGKNLKIPPLQIKIIGTERICTLKSIM